MILWAKLWCGAKRFLMALAFVLAVTAAHAEADAVGRETGLPIPRFVSLAADLANMRLGPRASDAIIAVYRRRGLPLKIVDEQDNWRQVEDFEGDRGWVHTSLLSGRRTVLVTGDVAILRRAAAVSAPAIARVEPKVVGQLLTCHEAWCFVEVERRRGWLPVADLWGVVAPVTR